jgi:hypothetical protein
MTSAGADERRHPVPSHPLALPLSAFAADTAAYIGGASAVLELVSPRCRQGSIELFARAHIVLAAIKAHGQSGVLRNVSPIRGAP